MSAIKNTDHGVHYTVTNASGDTVTLQAEPTNVGVLPTNTVQDIIPATPVFVLRGGGGATSIRLTQQNITDLLTALTGISTTGTLT